jgi:SAM-dependent methyltransferase
MSEPNKWPKKIPELTSRQLEIREDFVKHWLAVLPNKYNIIEKFNHGFPQNKGFFDNCNTLEIGAGLGEHIKYEPVNSQSYTAMELREDLAKEIQRRYPEVKTIVGDCQEKINAGDGSFDRILAIHVLEHLPNLPAALNEIKRVLNPSKGKFIVVIPCEGGIAYNLARDISARKIFEKKYNEKYDWFVKTEHINYPEEILEELNKLFTIQKVSYFPLKIPSVSLNLCIGLVLISKKL